MTLSYTVLWFVNLRVYSLSTVTLFLGVNPGFKLSQILSQKASFFKMPRIAIEEVLMIMLINSLEDIMNRRVPRFAAGGVPFARHMTSQARLLKLWVKTTARVIDSLKWNTQVMIEVEHLNHPASLGYIDLSRAILYVVAIRCKITRVDLIRIHALLKDLTESRHVSISFFRLLRRLRSRNNVVTCEEFLKRCGR